MRNANTVGVLFTMNGENYVTMLAAKSRNRFKRLIKNWVDLKGVIQNPQEGQQFTYIPIQAVLDDVEATYKEFKNTPAAERIAVNALKLIDTIRAQQDEDDEDDLDDEVD